MKKNPALHIYAIKIIFTTKNGWGWNRLVVCEHMDATDSAYSLNLYKTIGKKTKKQNTPNTNKQTCIEEFCSLTINLAEAVLGSLPSEIWIKLPCTLNTWHNYNYIPVLNESTHACYSNSILKFHRLFTKCAFIFVIFAKQCRANYFCILCMASEPLEREEKALWPLTVSKDANFIADAHTWRSSTAR